MAAFQGCPLPSGPPIHPNRALINLVHDHRRLPLLLRLLSELGEIIDGEMLSWQLASLAPNSLRRRNFGEDRSISSSKLGTSALNLSNQHFKHPCLFVFGPVLPPKRNIVSAFLGRPLPLLGKDQTQKYGRSVDMAPAQQASMPNVISEPSRTGSLPSQADFVCHEFPLSVLQR